jgi:hypothetical protein
MLEHLISDYQIIQFRQRCGANVEVRIVGFRIALKTNVPEPVSGRDFESVKLLRSEGFNKAVAIPIHRRANPRRVIVSDCGQNLPNERTIESDRPQNVPT